MCRFDATQVFCPCQSLQCPRKLEEIGQQHYINVRLYQHKVEVTHERSKACDDWLRAHRGDIRGSRACPNSRKPGLFNYLATEILRQSCTYCQAVCKS